MSDYVPEQPAWVCFPCGHEYGRGVPEEHVCTAHLGICGVCDRFTSVVEPRDFGFLKPEWQLAKAVGGAL